MPSMVPPGYTRGPILFMRPTTAPDQTDRLLQHFWDNAGAYGARILLIALDPDGAATARSLQAHLAAWEVDTIATLSILSRAHAWDDHQHAVDAATALLLVTDAPRHAAAQIGGTPLAQALRRANAHGKAVAAYGTGTTILCQHMLVPPPEQCAGNDACFAPGLGLVNRLAVDTPCPGDIDRRLHAAVKCNPFLVAVALDAGAGVAVYPDTTMETIGAGTVRLATVTENRTAIETEVHTLTARARYNFDAQALLPRAPSDIPDDDGPVLSGF